MLRIRTKIAWDLLIISNRSSLRYSVPLLDKVGEPD